MVTTLSMTTIWCQIPHSGELYTLPNMTRTKTQKLRRAQARRKLTNPTNVRDTANGILGMPVAWPGSSAIAPGRANIRMVTEVFSTVDAREFSKSGFQTWSSQIAGILEPYKYFRVEDCSVEVLVVGGTTSNYSVVFNVSNSFTQDSSTTEVLNDDYSALATSLIRPKLRPPKAYWDTRPVDWYTYTAASDPGFSGPMAIAGNITMSGTGGATTSTVIAYLVAEFVLSFHTLK